MQKIQILIAIALFSSGCQKYYISISQDKIDKEYLASSYVGTPDPRQANPPRGDRLIVEWKVPSELLEENPTLHLQIIYRNYTESCFVYPMPHRVDYIVYTLVGEEYKEKKGILSYRAEILKEDGTVFREWKHQLWTRLIQIEPEPVLQSTETEGEKDNWHEREWDETNQEIEESEMETFPPSNHDEALELSNEPDSSS